ncbi:conserved hypothetical protein [Cenarchaeum symbiosum A]|uniref:MtN3 and saliva related transmembrane protein n=1 Tax=Cenarchaeum symbiosum (strain A) TaxID=414004 RepID=A0RWT6_CENSY|nr:conserved hypothetical protein [Cenarchaeum symbiosum A]
MTTVDIALLDVVAVAGGVLILSGWVHQIIKAYKTKSLRDVSWYLTMFIGAGSVLWITYGVHIWDVYIIGTNVAGITLMVTVILMKRKYDKMARRPPGPRLK